MAKVLVIGDIMLDSYWSGNTSRISPEAPIPILNINKVEHKIGGAGNVAVNLKALGADTHLIGIIGDDENGKIITKLLNQNKISYSFSKTSDHPTINKLRASAQNQQLIRMDFEQDLTTVNKSELTNYFKEQLPHYDIVIISDYAKGTLSNIRELIILAKKAGKKIIIDPKGLDFSKYAGANIIKPNLKEFEDIQGQCNNQEDLINKAQQLRQTLKLDALIITQGSQGSTLISKNTQLHQESYSQEVYDVTGAGDTVIATIAASLSSNYSLAQAMHFANIAASCVIKKLGAAIVTCAEINQKISNVSTIETGILSQDNLLKQIQAAQSIGKKIVFTNGCFDLLHAGHVEYLKKAKQQGDYLVLAVNDDESIRRLKGENRPISNLESRLKVLDALEAVDWVTSFAEDDPKKLLKSLKPDILVKGTDYSLEQIVGHEIVLAYGGQVKRISHQFAKYSSSNLIKKLKIHTTHKKT